MKIQSLLPVLKKVVQLLWAAPVTVPYFLGYVLPCWLLGWYKPLYVFGDAWVFVHANPPSWLKKLWQPWGGQCGGNVIVLKNLPHTSLRAGRVLKHELVHTAQVMRWGILQPVLYAAFSLYALATGKNSYRDNMFEAEAYDKED